MLTDPTCRDVGRLSSEHFSFLWNFPVCLGGIFVFLIISWIASEVTGRFIFFISINWLQGHLHIFAECDKAELDELDEDVTDDTVPSVVTITACDDIAGDALGDGVETLGDGVETLGDGVETLGDGVETLGDGVETLGDGEVTLGDGVETLGDGVESVGDCVEALCDGMVEEPVIPTVAMVKGDDRFVIVPVFTLTGHCDV